MAVFIRSAMGADLPKLAQMNKRLIEDEGSRNPMDVAQLEARLRGWLDRGEWQIDVIELHDPTIRITHHASRLIGYAVYQRRADDYDPMQPVVYVRQFYIEREWRGQGLGRRAFRQLAAERFPPGATLTLEVLATNPRGRRFWESVGFSAYCTTLKLQASH